MQPPIHHNRYYISSIPEAAHLVGDPNKLIAQLYQRALVDVPLAPGCARAIAALVNAQHDVPWSLNWLPGVFKTCMSPQLAGSLWHDGGAREAFLDAVLSMCGNSNIVRYLTQRGCTQDVISLCLHSCGDGSTLCLVALKILVKFLQAGGGGVNDRGRLRFPHSIVRATLSSRQNMLGLASLACWCVCLVNVRATPSSMCFACIFVAEAGNGVQPRHRCVLLVFLSQRRGMEC